MGDGSGVNATNYFLGGLLIDSGFTPPSVQAQ
jgi:hypothetical protein